MFDSKPMMTIALSEDVCSGRVNAVSDNGLIVAKSYRCEPQNSPPLGIGGFRVPVV